MVEPLPRDTPAPRITADTRVLGELARIDRLIAAARARRDAGGAPPTGPRAPHDEGCALPPLVRAADRFGLTSFERDVVLLALACELDDRYGRALAALDDEPARRRPTVSAVLRVFAELVAGEWTAAHAALGPGSRLFALGLVDFVGPGPHASREVALRPAFWPRLVGQPEDATVALVRPDPDALARLVLAPAQRAELEGVVAAVRERPPAAMVVTIAGPRGSGREAVARAIAGGLGRAALLVEPAHLHEPDVQRDLVREAVWHDAAVIARLDAPGDASALARVIRFLPVPVIVVADERAASDVAANAGRSALDVALALPDRAMREELWASALAAHRTDPAAPAIDAAALAARFCAGPGRITAAVDAAAARAAARGDDRLQLADLEDAARRGPPGGALAQRITLARTFDELVVPAPTRAELDLLLAWARHGGQVFGPGGNGARALRNEGVVALFAGPPGTGKTMAAHVIATELGRDLWRIDLSQVVNKYIGETEKNLDRVFTDADADGAILFFDEADALFGRRTEVRDAHDRYANLETAFLLQRIEDHRGTVILATNLERNLDPAFLRRIPIVAQFALPGPAERAEIWRRHLEPTRLQPDVDVVELATRLTMAGGDIRNAVATAAIFAATDAAAIGTRHLALAAIRELRKAGRLVSPDELGPWSKYAAELMR
jgi:hypothetical protein